MRALDQDGPMVRGVSTRFDRYGVLVIGCQWRGGGSEIGSLVSLQDPCLSTVDCSI